MPFIAPGAPEETPVPARAQIRFAEEVLVPQSQIKDKRARGGRAVDAEALKEEKVKPKKPAKKGRRVDIDVEELEEYDL